MPNTSIQSTAARKNPNLSDKFLNLLLENSFFIQSEDPGTANHALRNRAATKIINNRGMQQSYANIFLDNKINSLVFGFPSYDISGVSGTVPVRITATGHTFVAGDLVYVAGIDAPSDLNGKEFSVTAVATDVLDLHDLSDLPIDGTTFDAYTSGGKVYRSLSTDADVNSAIAGLFGDVDFLIDFIDRY